MITIGTQVESLNFGLVTVVKGTRKENHRGEYITVKFERTGREKAVLAQAFVSGNVCDLYETLVPGIVFKTSLDGDCVVVSANNRRSIAVQFLDTGNVVSDIQKDALLCGYVRDRVKRGALADARKAGEAIAAEKHQEKLGEAARKRAEEKARQQSRAAAIAKKKADEEARILAAKNDKKLYQKQLQENAVKALVLENMVDKQENPNDLNIDFKDRDGKWVLRFKMGEAFVQTRLGRLHNNMTQRAGKHNGYLDVTVSDDFKDAQKFCDWAVQQPGWGEGYVLEKDLLINGNRHYCAEACVFVPHRINYAIVQKRTKSVVTEVEERWKVACQANNLQIFLGVYPTQEEAYQVYKEYREAYVKALAEFYRNKISEVAYEALMMWECSVTY